MLLLTVILTFLAIAILNLLGWACTVGIIYLICACFSWKFSLLTATGIWLIGRLIYGFFPEGGK